MHRYYLQLLVALVSCVSLTQKAWCETTVDEEPSTPPEKGKFYQTHVFGERPRGCSVVYSADASAMSSTWKSSDFRLLNDVYTTGAYFENKIYSAESPTIHIPTVTYSDRLFVCLEEMFEVENFYDYVSVEASTDFGKTWNKIYGRSGYTDGLVYDYTEIVGYSNKDVKFRLNLVSDSSYTASGFSLKNFEILLWQYDNYVTTPQLRGLNIDPTKEKVIDVDIKTPTLKELEIQDVIWEDQNEGVISFRAEDQQGNFVPGTKINRNDINVVIKNESKTDTMTADCFSWTNVERRLDVALVVDFSSSMSTPITNMKNNLIKMCKDLDKKYDAVFSLARFGYSTSNKVSENFTICENENQKLYDAQTLEGIIRKMGTSGGDEYVYHAIDEMSKQTFYRANTTKVMIVLYNMQNSYYDDHKIFNRKTCWNNNEEVYCSDKGNVYDKTAMKSVVEGNNFSVFGIIYDQYGMGLLGDDYFGHFCKNAWPYDEKKWILVLFLKRLETSYLKEII
ncbi:MAG: VWA domain-containing protein [Bacteroidales bacterium]|nr:VWA domain-containing protein [Bacteroidales bacterium]